MTHRYPAAPLWLTQVLMLEPFEDEELIFYFFIRCSVGQLIRLSFIAPPGESYNSLSGQPVISISSSAEFAVVVWVFPTASSATLYHSPLVYHALSFVAFCAALLFLMRKSKISFKSSWYPCSSVMLCFYRVFDHPFSASVPYVSHCSPLRTL